MTLKAATTLVVLALMWSTPPAHAQEDAAQWREDVQYVARELLGGGPLGPT
jgi:hypothetical protein